jgi:hypothetical protein
LVVHLKERTVKHDAHRIFTGYRSVIYYALAGAIVVLTLTIMYSRLRTDATRVHVTQVGGGSAFTLLFASDPQLTWWRGGKDPDCSAEKCGPESNEKQVAAMNSISAATWPDGRPVSDLRGVMINGDLTAFFHDDEFEQYKSFYEGQLKISSYVGLGNHDYENNVDDCKGFSLDPNHCAKKALDYLTERAERTQGLSSFDRKMNVFDNLIVITGSFGYSFDVNEYRMVQLNNYPGYRVELPPAAFSPTSYNVMAAYRWLGTELSKASAVGKKVILNMHDMDSALNDPEFASVLLHQNVVAIFAGHIHQDYGRMGAVNVGSQSIPWFRSGSSECYKFIAAELGDTQMRYSVIDSKTGQPRFESVLSVCDSRGSFNGINYAQNDAIDENGTVTFPGYPLASTYLFEYKSGTGYQAFDRVHPYALGSGETSYQTWSSSWTSIAPFCSGGASYLFDYKANGDGTAIDQVLLDNDGNPTGTKELWRPRAPWSSGWSIIRSFSSAGSPYLFEYKGNGSGTAIDRIVTANGTPTETQQIWRPSQPWSVGWTTIEPFYVGSRVFLFEYKKGGNGTAMDEITRDGSGTPTGTREVWRASTPWSAGWTIVRPFYLNSAPYLFEYKGDGSATAIDKIVLDTNGTPTGTQEVWHASKAWSAGWTVIRPMYLNNNIYTFEYKQDGSATAVDMINIGVDGKPSGTTEIWRADKPWSDGWTTVEPFSSAPTGIPGICEL